MLVATGRLTEVRAEQSQKAAFSMLVGAGRLTEERAEQEAQVSDGGGGWYLVSREGKIILTKKRFFFCSRNPAFSYTAKNY